MTDDHALTASTSHAADVGPDVARRTWRSLEAVHGMIYFTPHAPPRYGEVGVTHHRSGYFGSRVAAMGPVSAEVVTATFYNFHPALVRRSMDGLWERTTPQAMLGARLAAVDDSLRQAFGDELMSSHELAAAASVLRRAALVACERPEGRPLFAAHAALDWPDEPHLALWHAQTLLREFRGDGHLAALVLEGLSGLDALVSHAASGDVPAAALQATRAWSDDEWAAGTASMAERGLVHPDGTFTDEGRAQRDRIESVTDRIATAPWAAIGAVACDELRSIGKVLTRRVIDAGLLAIDPRRFVDD
jgi:hypothetical protein